MLKRRNIIITAVLIITAITFVFCFNAISANGMGSMASSKVKIVLDAGHGGIDGGVSGINSGVPESEINLKVVKLLQNYLVSAGFSVILTRSSDAGLYGVATGNLKRKDMQKRKEIIVKSEPTLVISIHMNKYGSSSRRGAQVFYKQNDKKSEMLAKNIQTCFNGMEESTRNYSALTGDYYILNCTEYPSVICECGFLSNPQDEALLLTEEYRDKVAYNIFKGIIGYFSEASFNYINNYQ